MKIGQLTKLLILPFTVNSKIRPLFKSNIICSQNQRPPIKLMN
ncbi:MAG: hypothetical protein RLZZ04_4355 [Cyanobacteriota bacterium]|jgi:hypothetical protein